MIDKQIHLCKCDADIMELTLPPKYKFKEWRLYQRRLKRIMTIWF